MKNETQKQGLLFLGISCTNGVSEQSKYFPDPNDPSNFAVLVHRTNGISEAFYQKNLHWHDFYEMEFFYEGSGIQVLREESYDIKKWTMVLRTPKDIHTTIQHPSDPLKSFNLKFSPSFLPPVLKETVRGHTQPAIATLSESDGQAIHAEFKAMHKEFLQREAYFDGILHSSIERLCFLLFRKLKTDRQNQKMPDAPLQKLVSYLLYHFSENVSLSEMAKYVQLSPNYLSELFVTKLGQNYTQYVKLLRLSYARQILTDTDLPLSEIIDHCGFRSVSYFIRAFKQQYGISPSQFRQEQAASSAERNGT